MSGGPDNRLYDAPMLPVICRTCAARVMARKSSWEQTSVQWSAASLQLCVRRSEAVANAIPPVARPVFMEGCPELRSSIDAAVARGDLPVLDT